MSLIRKVSRSSSRRLYQERYGLVIDSDRRRMIFDQVRTKAVLPGTPIDDDPEFLGRVELWISGAYDMSELRSRYNDLTDRRAQRLRSVPVALEPTVTDAEQIDIPTFPAALASYRSASASFRSSVTLRFSPVQVPSMLTRTSAVPSSIGRGSLIRSRMRSAAAWPADRSPATTTTNSSPPVRATRSRSLTADVRRVAVVCRTISPIAWPCASLIALKPSRSSARTAKPSADCRVANSIDTRAGSTARSGHPCALSLPASRSGAALR